MTEPITYDYAAIIEDLERAGFSIHKIATRINATPGLRCQFVQVQRWQAGSIPKAPHAQMLRAIHAEVCRPFLTNVTISTSGTSTASV